MEGVLAAGHLVIDGSQPLLPIALGGKPPFSLSLVITPHAIILGKFPLNMFCYCFADDLDVINPIIDRAEISQLAGQWLA